MDTLELISLLLLCGLGWLWFDSMQARALALAEAAHACAAHGLQWLDQAVAIARLGVVRNDEGRLQLHRVYRFDFSRTGSDRARGFVVMHGHTVQVVNLGLQAVESRVLH